MRSRTECVQVGAAFIVRAVLAQELSGHAVPARQVHRQSAQEWIRFREQSGQLDHF